MTDEHTSNPSAKRHEFARRVVAGSGLLLIAATRPLWFSKGEFPQVPFFELLCEAPQWIDWALSGGLVVSLLAMMFLNVNLRSNLVSGAFAIVCLSILICLNQHRLQPWAWFLILATVATSTTAESSLNWLRWLVFGLYFFSGLSKLEPTFVNGGGNWLLDGLLGSFNQSNQTLEPSTRRMLLYLMPLGEIVAAFCVLVPRLRSVGFFLVVGMHSTLLLALGPFGLDHKPGVLLWNLELLLLAIPLLRKLTREGSSAPSTRWSKAMGAIVIGCGVVLPSFGQRWMPIVDQWPSWSVYATWLDEQPAVDLRVRIDAIERVPGPVPQQLYASDWFSIRIDQWSLEAVGAPCYPQRRFRQGVARSFIERTGFRTHFANLRVQDLDGEIKIIALGLEDKTDEFWLNSKPRQMPKWKLLAPVAGEPLQ